MLRDVAKNLLKQIHDYSYNDMQTCINQLLLHSKPSQNIVASTQQWLFCWISAFWAGFWRDRRSLLHEELNECGCEYQPHPWLVVGTGWGPRFFPRGLPRGCWGSLGEWRLGSTSNQPKRAQWRLLALPWKSQRALPAEVASLPIFKERGLLIWMRRVSKCHHKISV